jgi:hypothetical protein
MDAVAIGEVLTELLAESGIDAGEAVVAISDAVTTTRILSVPRNAGKAAVVSEFRRHVPIEPEKIAVHWTSLSPRQDGGSVFALASDREAVGAAAQAAHLAGLTPVAVDLKSLSIARAVGQTDALILDVNDGNAEMICLEGGLPALVHSFGDNGSGPGLDDSFVVAAARGGIRYYRQTHPAASTDRVWVTSTSILPPKALALLESEAGVQVETAPRPLLLPESVPSGPYLACAGLLMRVD